MSGERPAGPIRVEVDDLSRPAVQALLTSHLAEMHALSPPCSVHALDLDALRAPALTVWSAWDGEELLGVGALKELTHEHGEVKSMRTAPAARGRGVGGAIVRTVLDEARARGYRRVSLETGPASSFAAAHRLYIRHGFQECGPFADYVLDPYSVFFTLALG